MNRARFKILDAANNEDRDTWLESWRAWPEREVFGHPAYGELFRGQGDRLLCAAWRSEGGGVLFPFIARPLAREQWAIGYENLWDAVNPYGYGGPYVWGNGGETAAEFWRCFGEWACESRLVSLFARLTLFQDQILQFDGSVKVRGLNVVRYLDLAEDELWYDYAHKVRKNVKRARSSGLTVEEDIYGKKIESFIEIYYSTMDRRGAPVGYYFTRDFFSRLVSTLQGQFVFFHVRDNGRIVSTELVLVSKKHIYSFLGGTLADAFEKRPNDILKHDAILWGKQHQKSSFVLGGGYGGPDGIFRYKLSFAPHGEVPFRVGCRIDLPDEYRALVTARYLHEKKKVSEWSPAPGFFPSYRS